MQLRVLTVRDVWSTRTLSHQLRSERRKRQITKDLAIIEQEEVENKGVRRTIANYMNLLLPCCSATREQVQNPYQQCHTPSLGVRTLWSS